MIKLSPHAHILSMGSTFNWKCDQKSNLTCYWKFLSWLYFWFPYALVSFSNISKRCTDYTKIIQRHKAKKNIYQRFWHIKKWAEVWNSHKPFLFGGLSLPTLSTQIHCNSVPVGMEKETTPRIMIHHIVSDSFVTMVWHFFLVRYFSIEELTQWS